MSVRADMAARLQAAAAGEAAEDFARLPRRLRTDQVGVRLAMMRRLSASRRFALGDRAGVLGAAARRSGRTFRLDCRQRVVVKAMISRHVGRGAERGAALAAHLAYLGRQGAGAEAGRAEFFSVGAPRLDAAEAARGWDKDRHHFRLIISPEFGDRIADLEGYGRTVMRRVADDLGEPQLAWIGVCHFDTDQPHVHVVVRGRRADGRDLVIPRDYIAYGVRSRAAEAAQELLGDLSRQEAERRVWRETQAERFTALDRRLTAAAQDGMVEDGVGDSRAWSALTRGRLRTLERLGLAEPVGRRYRLSSDLEGRLRALQLRKDVLRTLNQRRLEGARQVRILSGVVRGKVVQRGFHDELGASSFVVVRDGQGVEHYGRLRGASPPELGRQVELQATPGGAQLTRPDRGLER